MRPDGGGNLYFYSPQPDTSYTVRLWILRQSIAYCACLFAHIWYSLHPNTGLKRLIMINVNKKLIRRWDSERELSLRRHRTRTTKYNRLVHKFRHRSTRLCVVTQVYQSQWNNAMQRPLRLSGSFKVTDFGTNRNLIYDFLLVINTNLPPILHRFQVMADYWSHFR